MPTSIARKAVTDQNERIETLKDKFCSDESFDEMKERKVEKKFVTVGYL